MARVFPRFRQFGYFYLVFSCAFKGMLGRCEQFGFGFTFGFFLIFKLCCLLGASVVDLIGAR